MRLCLLAMLGSVLAAAARAEAPMQKQDLFTAAEGGYAVYRIPGIVCTAKGTLLAYCEARKQGASDWGPIDLLIRRSTDGGRTWQPPHKLIDHPGPPVRNPAAAAQHLGADGDVMLNNPVLIADSSGAVHALYCASYYRCYYARSDDEGKTFSKPLDISAVLDAFRPEYDWRVLATGPGHGIQLRNGRLLVPVWLSTGTGRGAHRPSAVSVIYSDDHGATWHRGDMVCADPHPANPSETAAVELSDGRVMLNIRHESEPRLRAVTTSGDGATHWSPLRYDEHLPEPICEGSLLRLSRTEVLFSNPHGPAGRQRKKLTVTLSRDDGRTWPAARTVEEGPSAYSDLAAAPDGSIYCFYERGAPATAASLCLARFDRRWLAEGAK